MKQLAPLLLLLLATGCGKDSSPTNFTDGGLSTLAEKGKSYRWAFDDTKVGTIPENFFNVLGTWGVAPDSDAISSPNVFRQSGQFKGDDFPRVIIKDLIFSNFNLKVRCRPESGKIDQACGLLFRAQDSNNYYIARANALEGNINFYRVVNGNRQEVKSAGGSVSTGAWHTLEVNANANHVKLRWDGNEVSSTDDSTFQSGNIGLWTKADSVTAFDDLEATELP